MSKDLLTIYRNYIYTLEERQKYGTTYSDTDEIIEMYEEALKRDKELEQYNEFIGDKPEYKVKKKVFKNDR